MDKDDLPPNVDFQLPKNLRFLQRLVTLLTASMIIGILGPYDSIVFCQFLRIVYFRSTG